LARPKQAKGDEVIVYDLSARAVQAMTPVDLAGLDRPPDSPIGQFDFHGCSCGIASFSGRPPWELHEDGDEILHILAGESKLTVLGKDGEVSRTLKPGDLVIVPKGCWHRSHSPKGVTLFHMTPRDGGRHSWEDPRAARSA